MVFFISVSVKLLNPLKMNILKRFSLALCLVAVLTFSCKKDSDSDKKGTGIFSTKNDTIAQMDGVINSKSLTNFENLLSLKPNIKQINIVNCDGSEDDETNLKLSKKVHDLKIRTHVIDNGAIASGGVDFFLAGVKRTKGKNTKIGVHSWAGDGQVATDFPVGHKYHLPYIEYYKSVGFSQEDAEKFYYFTINAAPAENIHWMTEEEIETYKILK